MTHSQVHSQITVTCNVLGFAVRAIDGLVSMLLTGLYGPKGALKSKNVWTTLSGLVVAVSGSPTPIYHSLQLFFSNGSQN